VLAIALLPKGARVVAISAAEDRIVVTIEIAGAILYAQVLEAPTDGTSLIGRAVSVEFVPHGPDRRLAAFRLAA